MKNLITNNNKNFCHWNHNYLFSGGENILALQIRLKDAVSTYTTIMFVFQTTENSGRRVVQIQHKQSSIHTGNKSKLLSNVKTLTERKYVFMMLHVIVND